jgi:hypothetical protein
VLLSRTEGFSWDFDPAIGYRNNRHAFESARNTSAKIEHKRNKRLPCGFKSKRTSTERKMAPNDRNNSHSRHDDSSLRPRSMKSAWRCTAEALAALEAGAVQRLLVYLACDPATLPEAIYLLAVSSGCRAAVEHAMDMREEISGIGLSKMAMAEGDERNHYFATRIVPTLHLVRLLVDGVRRC